MNKEERIAYNESKGWKFVGDGDGFEVYKRPNEVGGWIYYSDACSNEGPLPMFDDCVISKEEIIIIAKDAYGLELK